MDARLSVNELLGLSEPMLATFTWVSWLEFVAALCLFAGPGYGLLSFYPGRRRFDRTQIAALIFALAISFWAIALAWLGLAKIALTPIAVGVILAAGWAVGLARCRPWRLRSPSGTQGKFDVSRMVLWIVVVAIAVIATWSLRTVVVGPGSDSYHHTLITQLISVRGALPNNYQPYAPLVTFTYHYGFHAVVAAVGYTDRPQSRGIDAGVGATSHSSGSPFRGILYRSGNR